MNLTVPGFGGSTNESMMYSRMLLPRSILPSLQFRGSGEWTNDLCTSPTHGGTAGESGNINFGWSAGNNNQQTSTDRHQQTSTSNIKRGKSGSHFILINSGTESGYADSDETRRTTVTAWQGILMSKAQNPQKNQFVPRKEGREPAARTWTAREYKESNN